ncbi:hypothetical protein KIN20_025450 [Parelaphostrongylus tenuis]|uniref:Uncharacterized protein n=1 Tax=Parelaphostrongylus tenuis TaxID=148309 RepID=A0AAD5N8U5_PARTN|nr:hypothetical protein KIN20_025450 [Parelaphostrongylus tenuis]
MISDIIRNEKTVVLRCDQEEDVIENTTLMLLFAVVSTERIKQATGMLTPSRNDLVIKV